MAETYCGKSCAECVHKEELKCPGCRVGPGNRIGGTCDLAKCCRAKGHETCETCSFQSNCGTLRRKESVPDDRRRKLAQSEEERAAIAKRAPILGKWLWILFWLFIPAEAASLFGNETIAQYIPFLGVLGQVVSGAVNIIYCLILIRLGSAESRYRHAGICALIAWALNLLAGALFGDAENVLSLLLTAPGAILALVGEYQEFAAHENALWGVDNTLSDKWGLLWKWNIGSYGALLGCAILILFAPVLAAIVVIGTAIAILVIHVVKLVYLYRTAKAFRSYDPTK